MSSDTTPPARVWTHDDAEPLELPRSPAVRDKYGVRWVADEREDGFEGWRSDSHGFRQWRVWFNLAHERGPLTEDQDADEGCPERSDPKVIERVAHAISTAKYGRYVWDGLASCQQDDYREMASAAVQALLEAR